MTDLIAILLGVVLVNIFVLDRFPGPRALPAADAPPALHVWLALWMTLALALASGPAWLLNTRWLPAAGLAEIALVCRIALLMAVVHALGLAIRLGGPERHRVIGPFLPLVSFNAVAVDLGLAAVATAGSWPAAILTGTAAGVLFSALLSVFGAARRRLDTGDVPATVRGSAIALLTAAIASLAFVGLDGIWRG